VKDYEDTANELVRRIVALIPAHPEILSMDSPWDLFDINEFEYEDLEPSCFQAGWALANAKRQYLLSSEQT
jgi:hypothetical protein